jgi:hypothetical protein
MFKIQVHVQRLHIMLQQFKTELVFWKFLFYGEGLFGPEFTPLICKIYYVSLIYYEHWDAQWFI